MLSSALSAPYFLISIFLLFSEKYATGIKIRLADEPERYKDFLDALSAYVHDLSDLIELRIRFQKVSFVVSYLNLAR